MKGRGVVVVGREGGHEEGKRHGKGRGGMRVAAGRQRKWDEWCQPSAFLPRHHLLRLAKCQNCYENLRDLTKWGNFLEENEKGTFGFMLQRGGAGGASLPFFSSSATFSA